MPRSNSAPPKVFILPVDPAFQPSSQTFRFPKHNEDWGVEQDFLRWLQERPNMLCSNPADADFHYLPIFWTRFHLNHRKDEDTYGQQRAALQEMVDRTILDDTKSFTICQYADGPLTDLGRTTQFLASRQTSVGIDIPLLCSAHKLPAKWPNKRYLGSFVGRLKTHPARREMAREIRARPNVYLLDGNKGSKHFVDVTLASYVCIAPRGYGGSSFRLFEAMSLGIVPLIIGDIDTRPFKRFINWDRCSLFTNDPSKTYEILCSHGRFTFWRMGQRALEVYNNQLSFGRWCPYVMRELEAA